MDHSSMAGMDHSRMAGMPGMQSHPASETDNPLVDMQAMSVSPKLNDPGIGLRNNGRKVLTYADLKSRFEDPDGREPGRTIELHLTGHMEKFAWSFNGIKFSDAAPVLLKYGERLRITLINDTMMTHPIHLHGMWSDLEDENGNFMVRKHTIDVPPGTKRILKELIPRGFSAAVYTQTTDVEVEVNGLLTYDRKVIKLDEKTLRKMNKEICDALK